MPSALTVTVLTESQEGTIGDDWKYTLEAKVYSGALQGKDQISVAKHNLGSGVTQEPPGPPAPMVIPAADPGSEIQVDLRLLAEEVDLLRNDTGEKPMSFSMTCPPAGETLIDEREISVGVSENPSGSGNAVFVLSLRLELASS